jgi:hypothetical protein
MRLRSLTAEEVDKAARLYRTGLSVERVAERLSL